MQFNRYLRNYFGFSQTENKGFWVLVVLLVMALILPLLMNFLPNNGNLVSDQNKLDSLEAIIEIKQIKAKENSSFEAFDKTDFYPNFS